MNRYLYKALSGTLSLALVLDPVWGSGSHGSPPIPSLTASPVHWNALSPAAVNHGAPFQVQPKVWTTNRIEPLAKQVAHAAQALGGRLTLLAGTCLALVSPFSAAAGSRTPLLRESGTLSTIDFQSFGASQAFHVTREYVMTVQSAGDWGWRLFKAAKRSPEIADQVKNLTWEQFKAANPGIERLEIGDQLVVPFTKVTEQVMAPLGLPHPPDPFQLTDQILGSGRFVGTSELLFLSVGVAALLAVAWFVYRHFSARRVPIAAAKVAPARVSKVRAAQARRAVVRRVIPKLPSGSFYRHIWSRFGTAAGFLKQIPYRQISGSGAAWLRASGPTFKRWLKIGYNPGRIPQTQDTQTTAGTTGHTQQTQLEDGAAVVPESPMDIEEGILSVREIDAVPDAPLPASPASTPEAGLSQEAALRIWMQLLEIEERRLLHVRSTQLNGETFLFFDRQAEDDLTREALLSQLKHTSRDATALRAVADRLHVRWTSPEVEGAMRRWLIYSDGNFDAQELEALRLDADHLRRFAQYRLPLHIAEPLLHQMNARLESLGAARLPPFVSQAKVAQKDVSDENRPKPLHGRTAPPLVLQPPPPALVAEVTARSGHAWLLPTAVVAGASAMLLAVVLGIPYIASRISPAHSNGVLLTDLGVVAAVLVVLYGGSQWAPLLRSWTSYAPRRSTKAAPIPPQVTAGVRGLQEEYETLQREEDGIVSSENRSEVLRRYFTLHQKVNQRLLAAAAYPVIETELEALALAIARRREALKPGSVFVREPERGPASVRSRAFRSLPDGRVPAFFWLGSLALGFWIPVAWSMRSAIVLTSRLATIVQKAPIARVIAATQILDAFKARLRAAS